MALYPVYRAGLLALLEQAKADSPGRVIDPQIQTLIDATPEVWVNLYQAEQRIAPYLSDVRIDAEATRRFIEAERLGVKSAADLKKEYYATGIAADRKRALFSILLDDLQFRYEKRRLDRREFTTTTQRLNWIGLFFLLIIIGATLNLLNAGASQEAARYHQFWVVYFGLLGAYFSRIIALAQNAQTFDYDALILDFAWSSIGRRLIAGALGALIVYCLIRGEILGGDLFPNHFKELMADVVLYAGEDQVTMPVINADFAKLIVWSTLAGFSERLIPDQFSKLERTAAA